MNLLLDEIAGRLKADLERWLAQTDEASLGLQELQEKLEALRPTLGAKAVKEASRALRGSKKSIRETRMQEAAEVVSEALREIGIRVEPKPPLKRVRRKKSEALKPSSSIPRAAESSTRDSAAFMPQRKAQ